jgi:zinc/manganese transport system substrate-binding protein
VLRSLLTLLLPLGVATGVCACGVSLQTVGRGPIHAVGAESQYANLISQIGGRYVSVTALIDNPNTDPHTFETSPAAAGAVSSARLVVQNGLGYDGFMNRLESAAPSRRRRVIDVQHLLGISGSESNPHLWYSPQTLPVLAAAVARALARVAPRHAAYFRANESRFDRSLQPWYRALAELRRHHGALPVATSEPVADYMLRAAGARVLTPYSLQLDVMNGTDPAPQNVTRQDELLVRHRVRAFLYNRQVTDSITQGFLELATAHHVPVVAVYETMPSGYDYQRWMLAETRALQRAVAAGVSTRNL